MKKRITGHHEFMPANQKFRPDRCLFLARESRYTEIRLTASDRSRLVSVNLIYANNQIIHNEFELYFYQLSNF